MKNTPLTGRHQFGQVVNSLDIGLGIPREDVKHIEDGRSDTEAEQCKSLNCGYM